ncbi:YtcA family lipoprotein [Solimicrobium silvestre]|uniref:Uncharacterized protein YtcA n=1 Tax=Solimicrobium silvestre TaxID=2099400 RepID=A0A2S9GV05_9BURK|nr:YtcA family lipoprotein [Solimicrobium silvestre]PRC91557.1 hypothetical protein S2091_3673 [Solimicrobium silvestre]
MTKRFLVVVFISNLLLSGCARSPSINVLGAYFPDWMFCFIGGILLAMLTHAGLVGAGVIKKINSPVLLLSYSALTAILAMLGWLLFFQN